MTDTSKYSIIPLVKRAKFGNIVVENLELGDILYFNYNSTERNETILNPLIVFGGIDKNTGLVMGASLRHFYTNKQLTQANSFLDQYENSYWNTETVDDSQDKKITKKLVNYTGSTAFRFENMKSYTSCNVFMVSSKGRKQVNLLQSYWRTYNPTKMYVPMDDFVKLTGGNISIKIDVASVIINIAPKSVTVQKGIE